MENYVNACENPDVLKVLYFGNILLQIIRTVIVIFLIVKITHDLFKAMTTAKEDYKELIIKNVKRIACVIFLFIIPWTIELFTNIIGEGTGFVACIDNANKDKIEFLEEIKKEQEEAESEKNITFSYSYIEDDVLPYAVFTPSSSIKNKNLGLIVCLHGTDMFGIDKEVFKNISYASVFNNWELNGFNAYVICPSLKAASSWEYPHIKEKILEIINEFIKDKGVNPKKIALTGHSYGTRGLKYLATGNQNVFSSLTFMSGYVGGGNIEDFKDMRVKGYVEPSGASYNYMQHFFVKTFGEKQLTVLDCEHNEVPRVAFNEDKNKNNKSDLIEWMFKE